MTRTQPNKGIPRHRERGIRMSEFKVIEIKKNILEDNDREADVLRSELKADRTFLLNLMSSPGSGKTTTLVRTIGALKDEMRIGVMEGGYRFGCGCRHDRTDWREGNPDPYGWHVPSGCGHDETGH